MERIAKIIRIISNTYDISITEIISQKSTNDRRKTAMTILCYCCYDAILKEQTEMTLWQVSKTINCSEWLICHSYYHIQRLRYNEAFLNDRKRMVNYEIDAIIMQLDYPNNRIESKK